MQLKFWGTRGDIPAPERDKIKYGGNTICLELVADKPKSKIYLDAGIGLMLAGRSIPAEINDFHIVLSHYHWDHIQGILPFVPFFLPKNNIHIYGYAHSEIELKDYLNTLYLYVFSPLRTIDFYAAKVYYHPLGINQDFVIDGIQFSTIQLDHGDFTLGYKVTGEKGLSFVYASDNEIRPGSRLYRNLIEKSKSSNMVIHNCKFNDADYKTHSGQGHSSLSTVLHFAKEAGVKRLGLIHYHPNYTDNDVDKMLEQAKTLAPEIQTIGAREGMQINF